MTVLNKETYLFIKKLKAFLKSHDAKQISFAAFILSLLFSVISLEGFAQIVTLPSGTGDVDNLDAAFSLIAITDSLIFKYGARILAGVAILSGAIALKNSNFGQAGLMIAAAIVIATSPTWVENLFKIGGGTLFSQNSSIHQTHNA